MPSTINKGTLLSQVDSIIASLNLSTDETQRLALFYKSAINAGSNTVYANSNVAVEIVSRLENTTSTDSKELLMLATGSSVILDDRMVTVANTTVLNALANISAGTIYFVESDGYPYIRKSDNTWTPLSKARKVYNAWSWGYNNLGQLGDGTTVSKSSPVSMIGGFTDWVNVASGYRHSAGVRANGTAWCWGDGTNGRLGNNTTTNSSSPVSVVGGFTDWIFVSAGSRHSIGLRSNGTLWGWGIGGTTGDNTSSNRSSPVSVVGGFTDWISVSSCIAFNIALRANGTAWAWGNNDQGQLGDGTTTGVNSPVSVLGGFTDWVFVDAGGRDFPASAASHALGIRANGLLYAWGNNTSGKLGDGTTSNRSSPVSVIGGFTDWISAIGGGYHSVALRANGTLWAWGRNSEGQLGDNTTSSRSSPVSVVGGYTDWVSVSAGNKHVIGLRANGTLWSWGNGSLGQLGTNNITNQTSPVSVVGGFTDWTYVSLGQYNSFGLRA